MRRSVTTLAVRNLRFQAVPDPVFIEYNHVTPGYFSLLGIPIVRGRDFSPVETHAAPGIIVTESTARRLWPGQDPLGKCFA